MKARAPLTRADERMIDSVQRAAFDYFLQHTHSDTGLVADTSRPGAPASIAVVGFALSAYPVAVERGWIARDEAVLRCLAAVRFFTHRNQSGTAGATELRGFYFHLLHVDTGLRD